MSKFLRFIKTKNNQYSITNSVLTKFKLSEPCDKNYFDNLARKLTIGEFNMCYTIFGTSMNYNNVLVVKNALVFDDSAMGIYGGVYFDLKDYKIDFSLSDEFYQRWFIHEMTHLWQYQQGFDVFKEGAMLQIGYKLGNYNPYFYDIDSNGTIVKHFNWFNMESQADILAHYYIINILQSKHFYNSVVDNEKSIYLYPTNDNAKGIMRRRELKRIAEEFINSSKTIEMLPNRGLIWTRAIK